MEADDRRVADGFENVVALHVRGSAPAFSGGPNQLRDFWKLWQAGRVGRFRICDRLGVARRLAVVCAVLVLCFSGGIRRAGCGISFLRWTLRVVSSRGEVCIEA